MNIENLEIKSNAMTGGLCAVGKHDGSHYYMDLSDVPFYGPEFMAFPCSKDGKVTDWAELICIRPEYVDRDTFIRCVKRFVENLEEE